MIELLMYIHKCVYCGKEIGRYTFKQRQSDGDTCGAKECERFVREEAQAEREEAHERLDRDMGY